MTCPVSCSSVREERWEGVPPGRWSMLAGVSGAVQLEGCRILCTVCLSTSYCILAHPWDREDWSPEKQLQWSEILSEVKVELGFESDTEIQLGFFLSITPLSRDWRSVLHLEQQKSLESQFPYLLKTHKKQFDKYGEHQFLCFCFCFLLKWPIVLH